MNNVSVETTPRVVAAVPPAAPASDFSKPVRRPKKGVLKIAAEVLNHGGPGFSSLPSRTFAMRTAISAVLPAPSLIPKPGTA